MLAIKHTYRVRSLLIYSHTQKEKFMTQFEQGLWYFLVALDIVAITLFLLLGVKIVYEAFFKKEEQ
jgi:hypothetical protein